MSRPLSDIQADLDAFYALRRQAATSGGIAEYSIDTGQGRQSTKRYTLKEITAVIRDLEAEANEAQTSGGPVFINFDRRSC